MSRRSSWKHFRKRLEKSRRFQIGFAAVGTAVIVALAAWALAADNPGDSKLPELAPSTERPSTSDPLVLVVGDSGLGKSALVRELIARVLARDPNVLVLAGRCYERELLPYKALDGIVDALSQFLRKLEPEQLQSLVPAGAAILTQIFPVLGRVAGLADEPLLGPADPQERRARAFAVLRELFVRLARSYKLLLYIDDLQWADADSHLLLADLRRQPDAPALSLVVTARPGARASLEDARRLELAPLSFEEARSLAGTVLGDAAAVTLAPLIAKETNGHPLFVQALAAHAKRAGGLHGAGVRLDDALLAHVDSVDFNTRRLLELAVVATSPLTPLLAARASGQDAATISSSVSELRALRLARSSLSNELGEIAPYHDRIRATVVDELDTTIREIRTTIFTLAPPAPVSSGLRAQVLELVASSARSLGFEPAIRFRGPVDSATGDVEAAHVVAVVREALTNVARHADARSARVEVAVEGGDLQVSIVDDGVGIPAGSRQSGLANLRHRAEDPGDDHARRECLEREAEQSDEDQQHGDVRIDEGAEDLERDRHRPIVDLLAGGAQGFLLRPRHLPAVDDGPVVFDHHRSGDDNHGAHGDRMGDGRGNRDDARRLGPRLRDPLRRSRGALGNGARR